MTEATRLQSSLPEWLAAFPGLVDAPGSCRAACDLLVTIDLGPLAGAVDACRRRRPGGRPAVDAMIMARSWFLCVELGGGRVNAWVRRLRETPWLCWLIGLSPRQPPPSVATHYMCAHRLARGVPRTDAQPPGPTPAHRFLRTLRDEGDALRDAERRGASVTESMRARLLRPGTQQLAREDLDGRLADVIVRGGLVPLHRAGVLRQGDLHAAVDGTVHRTHAAWRGRAPTNGEHGTDGPGEAAGHPAEPATASDPAPDPAPAAAPDPAPAPARGGPRRTKPAHGRPLPAAMPRWYSDPDATQRWSNASRSVEFGHLGLLTSTRAGSLDIPLLSAVARPHQGEAPESMRLLWLLKDSLRRWLPGVRLATVIADAGYDADAFYRFCHDLGADPVVADAGQVQRVDSALPRAKDGTTPLCPAGAPMLRHSVQHGAIAYHCPAKRNTRTPGGGSRYTFKPAMCPIGQPCEPGAMAPIVRIRPDENPRMNLSIARGSAEYRQRFDERTAVERLFAHQHERVRDRTYRRRHLWQIAMALHTLGRHAAILRDTHREALDQQWETLMAIATRERARWRRDVA